MQMTQRDQPRSVPCRTDRTDDVATIIDSTSIQVEELRALQRRLTEPEKVLTIRGRSPTPNDSVPIAPNNQLGWRGVSPRGAARPGTEIAHPDDSVGIMPKAKKRKPKRDLPRGGGGLLASCRQRRESAH